MSREISIPKMIECFSDLSDPRIDRCKRHNLIDIIVIGLCAMICGAEGPTGMTAFGKAKKIWLMQFLDLSHGVPSHDTFGRVLSVIEPGEFERCLLKWVNEQVSLSKGEVVALDGKTLRGSHNKAHGQESIEIVSAWAASQRLTLGQTKVADNSNEITAVPEVLATLNVEGCVVTVDAMNCQKTIAAQIRKQKADYVLALNVSDHVKLSKFRQRRFLFYQGHRRRSPRSGVGIDLEAGFADIYDVHSRSWSTIGKEAGSHQLVSFLSYVRSGPVRSRLCDGRLGARD